VVSGQLFDLILIRGTKDWKAIMDNILKDMKQGARLLAKKPGFTLAAVITLALGIGANTAFFSIFNSVLLKPLPYRESDRLIAIFGTDATSGKQDVNMSPLDLVDFRNQSQSLEKVAGWTSTVTVLTGKGEPVELNGSIVTIDFFDTLQVKPLLGRFFLPEEEQTGKHRVAVISHQLWKTQFGSNEAIEGQTATIGGFQYTIIGVLPPDFISPLKSRRGAADFYRPIVISGDPGARGGHFLKAIGRLKTDVSVDQAQAELNTITSQLEKQYPDTNTGRHTRILGMHEAIVGDYRTALTILLFAVGLLLLIACANVANLTLTRVQSRQKEMAIRAALGADRWKIARQLLTESLLLAFTGGALGLLLAMWATDTFAAIGSDYIPRAAEVSVDGRVLSFSLVISLATGILFGIAPALQSSKPDLNYSLKDAGRGVISSSFSKRMRQSLVIAQVALSVVLLAGAGLLAKSLWMLSDVDPGFSADNLLTFRLSLPANKYQKDEQVNGFYNQISEQLSNLPGVRSAGSVNMLPLSGSNSCDGFTVKEHPPVTPGQEPCAEVRISDPGYFQVMGIPLTRGRLFTSADKSDTKRVTIISEEMARQFFSGEDPLGRHIVYNEKAWEIIGTVGNVKHFGLDQEIAPEFYLPNTQLFDRGMFVILRTETSPAAMIAAVRNSVWEVDKDLAIMDTRTADELISVSVAKPRFRTLLLVAFAIIALLLASVGLYGVLSYLANQRTHEIGVRVALGASRLQIFRLVIGQGIVMTVAGITIGLAASFALTGFLSSLLFGVTATDPMTFVGVSVLLLIISSLACYLPARQAMKIDPMEALRYE
jgi:putative ABC transport system permease protein